MLRREAYYPMKMRFCDVSESLQEASVSVCLKVYLPVSMCLNACASVLDDK